MTRPLVLVATCDQYPSLHPRNSPLLAALEAEGIEPREVPWTDPACEWGRADAVLVSQTWDYTTQKDRFLAWVREVGAATRLMNSAEVIAWNAHKGYLKDLATRGAPTIPTAWLDRGARVTLADVLAREGWREAVVKPVVGAAARDTFRVRPGEAAAHEADFARVVAQEEVMVQPFLDGVTSRGEVSLFFFGGEYSHTVRKVPKEGDYRAHFFFGADTTGAEPTPEEVRAARQVLDASPDPRALYARVDLVPDGDGRPLLMELEMIEPILYLDTDGKAAARFARALKQQLA